MGRIPTLTAREVLQALRNVGYETVGQRGSHIHLQHRDGRTVSVPFHGSRDLGRGLVRNIIREAGLTREQFLEALNNS